jgi:membrane protease YdiL (CAAX protease family)
VNAALLALSGAVVATCWWPGRHRRAVAHGAVLLLAAAGLWTQALQPVALAPLLGLFALAWASSQRAGRSQAWALAGCVLLALTLGLGLWPGFAVQPLGELAPLKPGSAPLRLQFGLGKAFVAVALLQGLAMTARRPLLRDVLRAWPVVVVTALGVPLLAWALGYQRLAWGLPAWPVSAAWMAINLLLVCTVEEAFFRGVVQRQLAQRWPVPAAIAVTALLFGLAHMAGGPLLMALAMLAGIGYGWAYERAGQRIEAAITAHFAVNLVHFACLTYPTPVG